MKNKMKIMKKTIIACLLLLGSSTLSFAQIINWKSLQADQPNLLSLQLGYDFGITTQIAYNRVLNTTKPMALSLDYSFPMGKRIADDFKIRLGGQMEVLAWNGWSLTAKAAAVSRRQATSLIRLQNFGAELALQLGYYRPTWHIAGAFGFDKSIITHLKHTDIIRDKHPTIKDGWLIPVGGHFFYGILGSKTIGKTLELSLRAGFTNAQGNDENAILPYYAQVGLTKKF